MYYQGGVEKEVTEEGSVSFFNSGLYKAEWEYRDHVIRCVFQNSNFTHNPDITRQTGIYILYDGQDVSKKYFEFLNEGTNDSTKVRSTLENLALVISIIDKNLEDYIDSSD
jgi:hypothetical protein